MVESLLAWRSTPSGPWRGQASTPTHLDLEWLEPLERNTLRPLFCIAPGRAEVQRLRKLVSMLLEKGLEARACEPNDFKKLDWDEVSEGMSC
jgi:hypothetical protein